MKITGTKFRSFYPQSSLNFNFTVSNYTSNDFEIGVSGTDYIYFKFRSGIIKDHYNNIIGTFNKEPVNIDAYIKEPFIAGSYVTNNPIYKSYLNSTPLTRNEIIVNPTSVFDSIVAKILDGPSSNSLDLEFYVNGERKPVLEFTNFSSNTTVSGTITNKGEDWVEIFSMSSTSITGSWIYDTLIYPGDSFNFFNNDVSLSNSSSKVFLDLETNFGTQSYLLYTSEVQDSTPSTDPPEEETDTEVLPMSSLIYTYSGEITNYDITTGIYKIDYVLNEPEAKIDLLFETNLENNGQEVEVTETKILDIYYSGILPSVAGKANGILRNEDFSITIPDYSVEGFSDKQDIVFSANSTLEQSFANLIPTGLVVYNVENSDTDILTKSINDIELSSNFYMDLGGKTGLPLTLESQSKTYERLNYYKGLSVVSNFTEFSITGEVTSTAQNGQYFFESVDIPIKSGVLRNSINYPSITMGPESENSKTVYPYRGVGYANLNDQSLVLQGEIVNSKRPYLFLIPGSDAILFKNLNNIDYNGQYKLKTTDQIKCRVFSEALQYSKEGTNFNFSTSNNNGIQFINNIIHDGIKAYAQLTPFQNLDNSKNEIYRISEENVKNQMSLELNWDDNNLVALRKSNDSNLLLFYSSTPNLKFGLVLSNSYFNKKEGSLNSNSTYASKNKIQSFYTVATLKPSN
jgi:hypothetical protein